MSLLSKLDDAFMYGVNKAVGTWNWTTGGTKADLANTLLTAAPLLEAPLFFYQCSTGGAAFVSFVMVSFSHFVQGVNREIEDREGRALRKECMDLLIEDYKGKIGKYCGLFWGGLSLCNLTKTVSSDVPELQTLSAIADASRASSFYVMRADYLPPRKNCLSRAIDRLSELVKSYSRRPIPTRA